MTIVPMKVAATQAQIPINASSDTEIRMGIGVQYNPTGGGGGASFPPGGQAGDLLAKRSSANDDVEWITPANSSEQDNTRPITAAAVYTEIGNINALLATI